MTIYALSTGPGVSGVAIVRISGPESSIAIKSLTGKKIPSPRVATLRKINNITSCRLIYEGVNICLPCTNIYTGRVMT